MKFDLHFISGSPNFSLIQTIQQKWLYMTSRGTKVNDFRVNSWKNQWVDIELIEIDTFLENCRGFDNPLIAQES